MESSWLIVIGLLGFLSVTVSAGQPDKSSSEIDPDIWLVKAGGLWTKNDREYGNVCVFVKTHGWEHTRSFLYFKWLKSDDDKQQVVVLKTIPIPEFNEGDWRNIVGIKRKNNTFLINSLLGAVTKHKRLLY